MSFRFPRIYSAFLPAALLFLSTACGGPEKAIEESLRTHVLFFANFEKGVDALDSAGEPLANFDTANTHHLKEGGIPDGYLSFNSDAGALNYFGKGNLAYRANEAWSGGITFWLQTDLASFESNYPEPFHIGKKDGSGYPWDDAVIFLDFKKADNALRFGCYPDKNREITDQMVAERVISVPVKWKSSEWHHVALTWSNFNSGKADAEWALYVDGTKVGRKGPLRQNVSWDLETLVMRFNHFKYPGRIDEIAVFDKTLTPDEIKYLAAPKSPLNKLFYKKGERRGQS